MDLLRSNGYLRMQMQPAASDALGTEPLIGLGEDEAGKGIGWPASAALSMAVIH